MPWAAFLAGAFAVWGIIHFGLFAVMKFFACTAVFAAAVLYIWEWFLTKDL